MPRRSRMYVPGFPYPSGQRLCKALLSRPALPGSARTGEVLIGPRAPHTKKGHHEGGLSRYGGAREDYSPQSGSPFGSAPLQGAAVSPGACRARLEPGRCSSAPGHPIPKKATMKAAFPGMARPRGLLAAKRLALRVSAFARRCCLARRCRARLEPGRCSSALGAPHTKKGHHEGGLSRYGAPERITRRKAARPSGQRLCKALLSRPALPGSARTGEVLIGPRAPHTKKGHHEGGLSRYGAPERIRTSDTRLRKPFSGRYF